MRKRKRLGGIIIISIVAMFALFASDSALAQETTSLPDISINVGGDQLLGGGTIASTLKLVFMISIISFAPALILTCTCFTRIAVVLSMTRTALGVQQMPPNLVITGLSLFLTVAIMSPVFNTGYQEGIVPFLEQQMDYSEAVEKAFKPLKAFLVRHAREKDLALFIDITKSDMPASPSDVPIIVAVPAFVLSELNTAFQIGFLIALPFLVLDMVVSSVLTSMSMITLPPVVISLPLKLMLFVLVDGWHLIISSLVQTYRV